LPVKHTLWELDVPRSSFYRWYRRYQEQGYGSLANQPPNARRFWNKIPESEKRRVVDTALEEPELTLRELAWHITDSQTPADVYHRRARDIITARNLVKKQTLRQRRRKNLGLMPLNEEIIRPDVYRKCVL